MNAIPCLHRDDDDGAAALMQHEETVEGRSHLVWNGYGAHHGPL